MTANLHQDDHHGRCITRNRTPSRLALQLKPLLEPHTLSWCIYLIAPSVQRAAFVLSIFHFFRSGRLSSWSSLLPSPVRLFSRVSFSIRTGFLLHSNSSFTLSGSHASVLFPHPSPNIPNPIFNISSRSCIVPRLLQHHRPTHLFLRLHSSLHYVPICRAAYMHARSRIRSPLFSITLSMFSGRLPTTNLH